MLLWFKIDIIVIIIDTVLLAWTQASLLHDAVQQIVHVWHYPAVCPSRPSPALT